MPMLTDAELAAIVEKAQQATPGPWFASCPAVNWRVRSNDVDHRGYYIMEAHHVRTRENAAYIAALSPDVVLALVEEVRALRVLANEAQDRCAKSDGHCWCGRHGGYIPRECCDERD